MIIIISMARGKDKKTHRRYLRIRTLMLKKGITGGDIARTLGMTRTAINAVIKGFWPSPRVQDAVAEILGAPYEKLWGEAYREPDTRGGGKRRKREGQVA